MSIPNNNINDLSEPFKSFVLKFLEECKKNSLPVFIVEGYRSQERQDELYAQGRTKEGKIVTWLKKSNHTGRQAIDIGFNKPYDLYPSDITVWNKVYDIGEKYYLKSLYRRYGVDLPHLDFSGTTPYEQTKELLNYISMTAEQKQLCELLVFSLKASHNFGTKEMKDLVEKQVGEWKSLIQKNEKAL